MGRERHGGAVPRGEHRAGHRGRFHQMAAQAASRDHLPRRYALELRRDPGKLRVPVEVSGRRPRGASPFYPETGATEIIDDLTIQFNPLDANAYFPAALTSQLGYVASPTWLAAAAADPALNQQPVGTGPFVFDSRSADSITRFVRNTNWWNGEVLLDAIEFEPVPDDDTRNELFFAGELQAIQTDDEASIPRAHRGRGSTEGCRRNRGRGFRHAQHVEAAVRRHPRPSGARPVVPTGELPPADRARNRTIGEPAVHRVEQVLQP